MRLTLDKSEESGEATPEAVPASGGSGSAWLQDYADRQGIEAYGREYVEFELAKADEAVCRGASYESELMMLAAVRRKQAAAAEGEKIDLLEAIRRVELAERESRSSETPMEV